MGLTRAQQVTSLGGLLTFAAAAWLGTNGQSSGIVMSQLAHRAEFKLEDSSGRSVTQDEFRGKFLLVLFGFTKCPEICPTTLSTVGDVMDALGEDADQVQPLFISVDPERDAASDLDRYTTAFHPSILGLTGSPGALLAAAENFHVFYGRREELGAPEGYSMEHSSSLFLFGPDGAWLRAFPQGTPAAKISAELSDRLE